MDIAALSMAMSTSSTMQSVNIAVMDKVMDQSSSQAMALVEQMAAPSEHLLDVRA